MITSKFTNKLIHQSSSFNFIRTKKRKFFNDVDDDSIKEADFNALFGNS
jgi:hypothetical protein